MRPINARKNGADSIVIRFRFDRHDYSFAPIPGGQWSDKRDRKTAEAIAVRIQNDILAGVFDSTLGRYKLTPTAPQKPAIATLLELFDLWVLTLDVPEATLYSHYTDTRKLLLKAPKAALTEPEWLDRETAKLAAATFNRRLRHIRNCLAWGVEQGIVGCNPYDRIKSRKAAKQSIRPFTEEETKRIVAHFKEHEPTYYAFVQFLFMTGARVSEAIGIRSQDVDLAANVLRIESSLSRDRTGNGYRRIRKATKTEKPRSMTMSDELRALLEPLASAVKQSDELLFRSPHGKVIDDMNFRHCWQRVLSALAIDYRKPHTIRHTAASRWLKQRVPVTTVAALLGHASPMITLHTYAHAIGGVEIPDLYGLV